jgi:hypothetical protein
MHDIYRITIFLASEAEHERLLDFVLDYERDRDRAALFRGLLKMGISGDKARWLAEHPGCAMAAY